MTPELGSAGPGPAVCVPLLATSPCAAQGPSSAGGGVGVPRKHWRAGPQGGRVPCVLGSGGWRWEDSFGEAKGGEVVASGEGLFMCGIVDQETRRWECGRAPGLPRAVRAGRGLTSGSPWPGAGRKLVGLYLLPCAGARAGQCQPQAPGERGVLAPTQIAEPRAQFRSEAVPGAGSMCIAWGKAEETHCLPAAVLRGAGDCKADDDG
ncbi:uncharacterized protein LOC118571505 [Onychomys torridus]|uniref:uncharacterized protein LOC118571505 n=1 Tax=Onychomys torridus TaxID=38674 RepID=UPI00167F3214|nr:uncharacterized protein LOC118571505 [Onychomys torridus]